MMNPKPSKSIFHSAPLPFPKIQIEEFMKNNEKRYEIITSFQNQVSNITADTYPSIIKYVEDNSECFLKDSDSAVLFLRILNNFIATNYTKLELIIDIGIHFVNEIKKCNITEIDIINAASLNTINYLFMKNAISIETIFENSKLSDIMFINFYPEISKHDPEYAQIREKLLNGDKIINLLNIIKSNSEEHIKNRNANFHPSPLHKAIREDDIDTFQSILSKNNYNVNYRFEYSIYERVSAIDKNVSLLQVAVLYNAINIFKFLWIQNDIDIDDNLQCYAYSGRNKDIIHLCEQKCSFDNVIDYAISSHQNDLVDYFIENFEDKLEEENKEIINILVQKGFDEDNENEFKKLPYRSILSAFNSLNYRIIFKCIKKIIFLIENFQKTSSISNVLEFCMSDLVLFRFMLAHQNRYPHLIDSHGIIQYEYAIMAYHIHAIKVVISYENMNFLLSLLSYCLSKSPEVANLILDLQMMDGWEDFHRFCKDRLDEDMLTRAILLCNDDVIMKYVKLYNIFDSEEYITDFSNTIKCIYSEKMFRSLVEKISSNLPKSGIEKLANIFND